MQNSADRTSVTAFQCVRRPTAQCHTASRQKLAPLLAPPPVLCCTLVGLRSTHRHHSAPTTRGRGDRQGGTRAGAQLRAKQPSPQLRSACLGALEAWARACSVASSARAPCAHAARASGTTELLPRYTSNSARPSETASMRRSGASCAHAHGVGREGTDAGPRQKRACFSQQKVS